MMSDIMRAVSSLLMFAGMTPFVVAGAEATHPCASVASPGERLACYDRAFPLSPAVHEAAAEQARQDFGLQKRAEPLRNPGQSRDHADPDQVRSRVARVEYDRGNGRTITLENGQVWTLVEATSRGPLAAGNEVILRKGVLDGYLLVTPSKVGLRVRRVR